MLPIISYIINIIVILIIIYIFYVVYKKQKASEKEEEEGISEEYLENCVDVEHWSYTSMHKPDTLSTCTAYYQANDDIYIDNLEGYQEGVLLTTLSTIHPFYNVYIFNVNDRKNRYHKRVLGYDLKEWYYVKNPAILDIVIYTNGAETIFYFTDDSLFRTINIFKIKN